MIFVSFPRPPDAWEQESGWHAQIAHKVWHGLRRRFPPAAVAFVPWDAPVDTGAGDVLVTFLPNANYARGARIVGIENDTLIPERWQTPWFTRYGLRARVDDIAHLVPLLRHAAGLVILTNDVAIRRLRDGEPGARAHVARLSAFCGGNLVIGPHPIDRDRFRRIPKERLNRPEDRFGHRLMVYHTGWRKNSAEAIALLEEAGFERGRAFDVVARIDKNDPAQLRAAVRRFNIVFSGSFSETGPINLIEYVVQGFLVAGHEDWWPGYGLDASVWSYDPARREEMRGRLAWLLDPANLDEMEAHRDRICRHFRERRDMDWEPFNDRLAEVIRRAL